MLPLLPLRTGLLLLGVAFFWGCTGIVPGRSVQKPPPEPVADTGAKGWWAVRFQMNWPEDAPPAWHMDTLIALGTGTAYIAGVAAIGLLVVVRTWRSPPDRRTSWTPPGPKERAGAGHPDSRAVAARVLPWASWACLRAGDGSQPT